ncbi:MAG: hypothetical protein OEY66_07310 [Gammaproteobacteria bacterium]|nr:hypothetical protein [Gammaproteobacteria bacterium]
MLDLHAPNIDKTKNRNRSMTNVAEAARNMLDHKKTLETLIALDTFVACLCNNIRDTNPTLAQALAIDLQQAKTKMQQHLPPEIHGACDVVEQFAEQLVTAPSSQDSH